MLGKNGIVAGWGNTLPNQIAPGQFLHYAPVTVISNSDCKRYQYVPSLSDLEFCTIGAQFPSVGQGACFGDRGAPLIFYDNGMASLAGIVSWYSAASFPCAGGAPVIYIFVSEFSDWIRENTGI